MGGSSAGVPIPPAMTCIRGKDALTAYALFYRDPIRCMEHLYRRFGPACRIDPPFGRRGKGRPAFFLVGEHSNREVLVGDTALRPTGIWPVPAPPGTAQANLRNNYLTSHGAEHGAFAGAVAPHTSRTRVRAHAARVLDIARAHIAGWPAGEVSDMFALAQRLTQHYAFALLFGEEHATRIATLGALVERHHSANWSIGALLLRCPVRGLPYARVLARAEALQRFVLEWAEERKGCPADTDLRAAMRAARGPDGAPVAPLRCAAHLSGLALASYETSAITLTWAMLLLALHADVANALDEEINAIGQVAEADLDRIMSLPLLDAVIKETMRLLTPVPFLGFRAVVDQSLAGQEVPSGSLVVISPHLTHRLPDMYPEPDRFQPERWATIRPSTYAYLPFSGGARRCPGYWFAINNLKITLAVVLSRFRPSFAPGCRVDRSYAAVMRPRRGVPMRLDPREKAGPSAPIRGSLLELLQVPRA